MICNDETTGWRNTFAVASDPGIWRPRIVKGWALRSRPVQSAVEEVSPCHSAEKIRKNLDY